MKYASAYQMRVSVDSTFQRMILVPGEGIEREGGRARGAQDSSPTGPRFTES